MREEVEGVVDIGGSGCVRVCVEIEGEGEEGEEEEEE
jgi:hypothetical protein